MKKLRIVTKVLKNRENDKFNKMIDIKYYKVYNQCIPIIYEKRDIYGK